MKNRTSLSRTTMNAVKRYGLRTIRSALKLHKRDGEGACTTGIYLGLTTRQADAAIAAGWELWEYGIIADDGSDNPGDPEACKRFLANATNR